MTTKLVQLEQRIKELEGLADHVLVLAKRLRQGENAQPELSIKGQQWYRGARELLVRNAFSGLGDFDACYDTSKMSGNRRRYFTDIEQYIVIGLRGAQPVSSEIFGLFAELFHKARSLLLSVVDEVMSRELPVKTQLSFVVAANEFDTAEEILANSGGHEVFVRASGVIARVALERHLFTVADVRSLPIPLNPPTKKKAEASDVTNALEKASVITGIQKSELEGLFRVGNNCAHPREAVKEDDVRRLIERGRSLASIIL